MVEQERIKGQSRVGQITESGWKLYCNYSGKGQVKDGQRIGK